MKQIKVYELYPVMGRLSSKTESYRGEIVAVAAVSVKQAYYYAYSNVWATDGLESLGILWKGHRDRPTDLWNGKTYGGTGPRHGDGKRIILAWMEHINKITKGDD